MGVSEKRGWGVGNHVLPQHIDVGAGISPTFLALPLCMYKPRLPSERLRCSMYGGGDGNGMEEEEGDALSDHRTFCYEGWD